MTKDELARLRGEMFGQQVLLMHCLCFIAAQVDDPSRHLKDFGQAAVQGVLQAEGSQVSPRYLNQFQAAATSVVLHCVEAAQVIVAEASPRAKRRKPEAV